MKTRRQQMTTPGAIDGYSNFIGDDSDYRDWLGVAGQSRDSDALERTNFTAALERLGGEGDNVRVERYGHWAVGWIEEIYVRPGTDEAKIAAEIEAALEIYPVLDEDAFSREEMEEAESVWRDCYRTRDRIEYMRKHRYQFEARSFSELLACARGNVFLGYASDLLH